MFSVFVAFGWCVRYFMLHHSHMMSYAKISSNTTDFRDDTTPISTKVETYKILPLSVHLTASKA